MMSKVLSVSPNLITPVLLPKPTDCPTLILALPAFEIISISEPEDFLICSSDVGSAVPTPILPLSNAALKQVEANLKIKMKELDIKLEEIHAGDRNSAREMAVKTGDIWTPRIIAAVVFIVWGLNKLS